MSDPAPGRSVAFETDHGTLAVFDPKVLLHRMRQPKTWWRGGNVLDVAEVLSGKAGIFPIGAEGSFHVRLTLDVAAPLSEAEKALSRGTVGALGVQVTGDELFVGAAERLPGDGIGDRVVDIPGTGAFHRVPPGDYDVTVHVLDWRTRREFFDEDGEPLPTAPPDFVVVLAPRAREFDAPGQLPALLDLVPRAEASKASLHVPVTQRRASPPPRSSPRGGSKGVFVEEEEPPAPPSFGPFEMPLVRRAFRDVLRERDALEGVAPRFAKGTLVLKPRDSTLQTKEVPVEDLLGKVTRIRDQMRVLEQKVNAHETLEDEQKLALDAQVTAVYQAVATVVRVLAE